MSDKATLREPLISSSSSSATTAPTNGNNASNAKKKQQNDTSSASNFNGYYNEFSESLYYRTQEDTLESKRNRDGPFYCCCCFSFVFLILSIMGGFFVTGTSCVVRDVVKFDQVVCKPWKSVFGKVIVYMNEIDGTFSGGKSLLFDKLPGTVNVTVGYDEVRTTIKQGKFYYTSLYLQAGSGINITGTVVDSNRKKNDTNQDAITTLYDGDDDDVNGEIDNNSELSSSTSTIQSSSSSSSSSSYVAPCTFTCKVYFMNLDSFVNFRNGRGFTPLGTNYSGCGPSFSATLDTVDTYGEYYVVVHYPQDEYLQAAAPGMNVGKKKKTETQRSINATFSITARRAIIPEDGAFKTCEINTSSSCPFTDTENRVVIIQAHKASELEGGNVTSVPLDPVMHTHARSLLKGSYRATIFITLGVVSLVFILISLFVPWWRSKRMAMKVLPEEFAPGMNPNAPGTSPASSMLPNPVGNGAPHYPSSSSSAKTSSSAQGQRVKSGGGGGNGSVYEMRPSPPPSPVPQDDDFPSLDLSSAPPPQPLLDMIDNEYMMAAGGSGVGGGGGGGSSFGGGMQGRLIPMRDLRQSRSLGSGSTPNGSGGDTDEYEDDGSGGSSSGGAGSYTESGTTPKNSYHYKVVRSSVTVTDSPMVSTTKKKKGGRRSIKKK